MTSSFAWPSATSACCNARSSNSSSTISSRSHIRMSSATWSLRDRPVCSLAPAGSRRVSSASRFMWTSSRDSSHSNRPPSISSPIASSARTMHLASALVSTPMPPSMVAWAMEPTRSCRHNRRSNEIDSVNLATSCPGPLLNRPLRDTGDDFFIRQEVLRQAGGHSNKNPLQLGQALGARETFDAPAGMP